VTLQTSDDGVRGVVFDGGSLECLNLDVLRAAPACTMVGIFTNAPTTGVSFSEATIQILWSCSIASFNANGIPRAEFGLWEYPDWFNIGVHYSFGRRIDATPGGTTARNAGPETAILRGVPQCIIATLDPTNGPSNIHVDSAAVEQTGAFPTLNPFPNTDSFYVTIGDTTRGDIAARWFYGAIHELIIFRRVLTPEEIQDVIKHAQDYWGVLLRPVIG
jgi:hypothetical protein